MNDIRFCDICNENNLNLRNIHNDRSRFSQKSYIELIGEMKS